MRLVTIDNGNTHPNVGFFSEGILTGVIPLSQYTHAAGDYVLISSVGRPLEIKPSFDLKTKRSKTHFFDMKVDYSESLGDDRLIAGYGLFKKMNSLKRILLIDAGTFITCDLITVDGFKGGYILPGINRFLKIYSDSVQLPLLSKDMLFKKDNHELPHDTDEAILKGTEIYLKSTLEEIVRLTSPEKIIFTGGSAMEIKNIISSTVPFDLDRHLIHSALSLIFDHHLRQE